MGAQIASAPKRLYHGTASLPGIEREGFRLSHAGGGLGLTALWLTPSKAVAASYARSAACHLRYTDVPEKRDPDASPVVLQVGLPKTFVLADLRNCRYVTDAWRLAGYDLSDEAVRTEVWRRSREESWCVHLALLEKGFQGARIRSTLREGCSDEVALFTTDGLCIETVTPIPFRPRRTSRV